MHCKKCNVDIPADSVFCPICGEAVENDTDELEASAQNKCKCCGVQLDETMRWCPNCGTKINDSTAAESTTIENTAMKYCATCGKEIMAQAVICPYCGCPIPSETDKPSIGLNILSFFIPVIGLILYIMCHKENPTKAKSIGKWAFIGFVVRLIMLG